MTILPIYKIITSLLLYLNFSILIQQVLQFYIKNNSDLNILKFVSHYKCVQTSFVTKTDLSS